MQSNTIAQTLLFAKVENFNSVVLHATCVIAATRNNCSSALRQSALFHLHLSLTTARKHTGVCLLVYVYVGVWDENIHCKILLLWHFSFYVAHRCATGNFYYLLLFNCKRLLMLLCAVAAVIACVLFSLDVLYVYVYVCAHHKVCSECHAPAHNKIALTFKSMTWRARGRWRFVVARQ